jgi:hypothetical protein
MFEWPIFKKSCSGRDLNPQAFRHTPLKRTCLPIPPPERCEKGKFPQTGTTGKWRFCGCLLQVPLAPNRFSASTLSGEVNYPPFATKFEPEQEHEHRY